MNHWEILGPLTFSLELGCTPLMGSACLRKHGPLAYEMHLKGSVWMEGAVWARQSAWDRSHLYSCAPSLNSQWQPWSLWLILLKWGIDWGPSSLDLLPFVRNPSFFCSSMGWKLFNRAKLYKEYYSLLYFTYWFALIIPETRMLQVTSCALGLELTSHSGRQRTNCQFIKLSHHLRGWSWVLLLAEGGRESWKQAEGGRENSFTA